MKNSEQDVIIHRIKKDAEITIKKCKIDVSESVFNKIRDINVIGKEKPTPPLLFGKNPFQNALLTLAGVAALALLVVSLDKQSLPSLSGSQIANNTKENHKQALQISHIDTLSTSETKEALVEVQTIKQDIAYISQVFSL